MRLYAQSQVRYTAAMNAMVLTKQENTSESGQAKDVGGLAMYNCLISTDMVAYPELYRHWA